MFRAGFVGANNERQANAALCRERMNNDVYVAPRRRHIHPELAFNAIYMLS